MLIHNQTEHPVESLLESAVDGHEHKNLRVEVKYCPLDSRRSISGTYYRYCASAPNGLLIRLRINRRNKYPMTIPFKTSEYHKKTDWRGRETTYQKLRSETFTCPEHLLVAVFLHEFSHYLDHIEGKNGRYKQTKADRFAVDGLIRLGLIQK